MQVLGARQFATLSVKVKDLKLTRQSMSMHLTVVQIFVVKIQITEKNNRTIIILVLVELLYKMS